MVQSLLCFMKRSWIKYSQTPTRTPSNPKNNEMCGGKKVARLCWHCCYTLLQWSKVTFAVTLPPGYTVWVLMLCCEEHIFSCSLLISCCYFKKTDSTQTNKVLIHTGASVIAPSSGSALFPSYNLQYICEEHEENFGSWCVLESVSSENQKQGNASRVD